MEEARVYVICMCLQLHRAFDIFLLIHSDLREKRHLLLWKTQSLTLYLINLCSVASVNKLSDRAALVT